MAVSVEHVASVQDVTALALWMPHDDGNDEPLLVTGASHAQHCTIDNTTKHND